MCARTTCRTCGKPTWSGCGNHVEQALAGIPKSERCQGHARTSAQPAPAQKSGSFFSRLFGGE
ncbi:MAG: hypothetical protein U0869_06695 [Chloroflexota bacterium]